MNKLLNFVKESWGWLHILLSVLVVVISALVCIALNTKPEVDTINVIASGLGVWLNCTFVVEVYTLVGLSNPKLARHGFACDVVGALLGSLICLLFV